MLISESPAVAPVKVQLDPRTAECLRRHDERVSALAECLAAAEGIAKTCEADYHQTKALTLDESSTRMKAWQLGGAQRVVTVLREKHRAAEMLAREMRESAEAGRWRAP
jgi:hypothetical protein